MVLSPIMQRTFLQFVLGWPFCFGILNAGSFISCCFQPFLLDLVGFIWEYIIYPMFSLVDCGE